MFVETNSGLSPNANSPAIVAAIEAAVADGMDVINFSGGEPEIEPSRDIVALALDAAAAAGVVPVVAAGNEYNDFGAGSVSSPANPLRAITVGAQIGGSPTTRGTLSSPLLDRRPVAAPEADVTAPGVDVFSSFSGGAGSFSGTSMAAPHVAGAAALLRNDTRRGPLSSSSRRSCNRVSIRSRRGTVVAGPRFQGGGVVALVRADQPLLFARPTALSFGLLERGRTSTRALALA